MSRNRRGRGVWSIHRSSHSRLPTPKMTIGSKSSTKMKAVLLLRPMHSPFSYDYDRWCSHWSHWNFTLTNKGHTKGASKLLDIPFRHDDEDDLVYEPYRTF